MNIAKYCLVLLLVVGAVPVNAAVIRQTWVLEGTLTSLVTAVPGMPTLTTSLDPLLPAITGFLDTVRDGSQFAVGYSSFQESYHHVVYSLPDQGLSAIKAYPTKSLALGSTDAAVYDPLTRVLTLSRVYSVSEKGVFCTGAVSLCAALYRFDNPYSASLDLVLAFNSTMNSLTGHATFRTVAGNGLYVDGRYDFYSTRVHTYGEVPVPAAGWLLGSGLLSLVGVVRQRRRRSVMTA